MSQHKLIISNIFTIKDQGTVFRGEIIEGQFDCGQRVNICSPKNKVSVNIQGIETIVGKIVRTAKKGETVSFMFKDIDFEIISDGVSRDEHGDYEPIDLHILNVVNPWWKFWK